MSPSSAPRFPFWKTSYRNAEGQWRTFATPAVTLADHLALLALEPDFSPSITSEHELCWDAPNAVQSLQ